MKSKKRTYYTFILVFSLTLILTYSCSTKKSTFTHRFYHNLTSRYNAYFNGNESFKTGVIELNSLHDDDYSKILPIYKLGTEENATSLSSYFEKAYTKASIVISRHSIFIKRKEHVRWVPESYFLIGKSYFYKQEYKLASEVFEFIIGKYPDFPVKYNAMVWLAKTYVQQKKYEKAESMLTLAENKMNKEKKQVPKLAKKEFPMVYADFYIKQRKYEQAVEPLLAAIDLNKKKAIKTRLSFILAQVYQELGNIKAASNLYDKVIRMNPPYEMEFNAKINKAICFDRKQHDSKEIKNVLAKMAKDTKNKEYLDQIYYALAEVCMKEEDTLCALENYGLSALKSVSNNNQKAISYLKMAKLYFAQLDYENASMFYDSTMTVLPADFPEYSSISKLTTILKKLVINLNVVEMQDSLQMISKLPEDEKNKIIDQIITEVIKKEQKKQEEAYNNQQNTFNTAIDNNATGTSTAWYFYNPAATSFGKTEFIKKWGNRKQEDLWRLKNKEVIVDFNTIENVKDISSTDSLKTTLTSVNLKDKKYYLKNIPTSQEEIKKSDSLIAEALYNIGIIYQTELKDIPKAINNYEKFITRFPNNENLIKTYYQMYLIYKELNDNTQMNKYKNLICSLNLESDYCNIIKNPNYRKISDEAELLANTLYKETYLAYTNNKWDSVMNKSTRAINLYGNDTNLTPKFMYLKALALAKRKDSLKVVNTLETIIKDYASSQVSLKAKDLLDFYTGKNKNNITNVSSDLLKAVNKEYLLSEDAIHLYTMIVTMQKNTKIADVISILKEFNDNFYSNSSLTINNAYLDDNKQIITISNFANKLIALDYYNTLLNNSETYSKLNSVNFTHFLISVDNYPLFSKNKDIDNYYQFFSKNYFN